MARITIAVVLSSDADAADEIIEYLRHLPYVNLIHVQTSYGKLWIQKGDAP